VILLESELPICKAGTKKPNRLGERAMNKNSSPSFFRWVVRYSALLFLFSVFSFSLTDPNLVLTSWNPYWQFQQWMWQTFFHNAPLLTYSYTALILGLFAIYFATVKTAAAVKDTPKFLPFLVMIMLAIIPLLFSYNMLSHDVFNYIFNAKMVSVYHTDPHIHVALDFPQDNWTRFMHNTHTPAPYGYGWTVLSLLPYMAGFGKFTLTWLIFRGWSVLGFVLCIGIIFHLRGKLKLKIAMADLLLLFLNPLLIIETLSTMHNDLWMMVPAVLAIGLVVQPSKQKFLSFILSGVLLAISASMKLATIVLLPLWIFFFCYHFSIWAKSHQFLLAKKWKKVAEAFSSVISLIKNYWAEVAVVSLFVPLLTDRAQQFHPWYLSWLLVWIPFLKIKWMKWGIITLSISSLLRYIPWLWSGGFSNQELFQQKTITWVPFLLFLVGYFLYNRLRPAVKAKSR
jgi:hypothetical protein